MAQAKQGVSPLPLAGIRVLDLTRALAGPFCSMILGDFGADVVKVEPAPDGDVMRCWGPFDRGESVYFLSANRNKRSLALDLRNPQGSALLREMALKCDVLIENFKPGTTKSMGLDYETLAPQHPGLIYAAVSGFGSSGPAGSMPGLDQIAQAYCGLMSVTGTPESGPLRVGVAIGDSVAGLWTVIAVLAAIRSRDVTGRGQRVETSLLGGLVSVLGVQGQRYLSVKEVPGLIGNVHPTIAPYGSFAASDGEFCLAPATPALWGKMCSVLGLEALANDERFRDNAARIERRDELKALMEEKLQLAPRALWIERMVAAGIPAGPINSIGQALSDPQVLHCGLVESTPHPTLGEVPLLANPIDMRDFDHGCIRRAPPLLGQHSVELLESFGMPKARIDALLEAKVVLQK